MKYKERIPVYTPREMPDTMHGTKLCEALNLMQSATVDFSDSIDQAADTINNELVWRIL